MGNEALMILSTLEILLIIQSTNSDISKKKQRERERERERENGKKE